MSADLPICQVAEEPSFAWLKEPALGQLFDLLNRDGSEVRVVGGAVRNALMGEAVGDIDCATTATPERVMELARAENIRALPTGFEHGTITLLIEDQSFEVTTLRADIETDGRHAKVAFGRDWQTDAERRDFTMNALYVDHLGQLYDPTGRGVMDAKDRFVRFIGSAPLRIAEDHLRALRFFRFFAQYGKHHTLEDYEACIAAQADLAHLSGERVGAELRKLLSGRFALDALDLMHRGGMVPDLFAAVPHITRFARLQALARTLRLCVDPALGLTALCVEVPEDAHRIAAKLRLPNRTRDRMAKLSCHVRAIHSVSEEMLLVLAYQYGKELAVDLVLFALVRRQIDTDLTELSMQLRNLTLCSLPVFPLSGRDLMDKGMKPGPDLGKRLAYLEECWIASGFALSRNALLALKPKPAMP